MGGFSQCCSFDIDLPSVDALGSRFGTGVGDFSQCCTFGIERASVNALGGRSGSGNGSSCGKGGKGFLKEPSSTGSSNGNAAANLGTDGSLAAMIDSSSSSSLLPYQGVLGSFASFWHFINFKMYID